MALRELSVSIGFDIDTGAIDDLNNSIDTSISGVEGLGQSGDDMGANIATGAESGIEGIDGLEGSASDAGESIEDAGATGAEGLETVGEGADSASGSVEDLGSSAEDALGGVEESAGDAGEGVEGIGSSAQETTTSFDDMGEQGSSSMDKIVKATIAVQGAMLSLKGIVAGTGFAMVNSFGQQADAIDQAAMRAGVGVEEYQEMTYALDRMGVSESDSNRALERLTQRMGRASAGNEKYIDALTDLGINMDDVRNGTISTDEAFMTAIDTLGEMENASDQASAAGELFGTRLGRRLLPAIEAGSEGMEEFKEQAYEFGIILDEETIDAGLEFTDTLDDIKYMFGGMSNEMKANLLPIFQTFLDFIIDNMPAIRSVMDAVSGALTTLAEMAINGLESVFSLFEGLGEFDSFGDFFSSLIDSIGEVLPEIAEAIPELIQTIISKYEEMYPEILSTGVEFFTSLIMGIAEVLPEIVREIIGLVETIIETIISMIPILIETGIEVVLSLIDGILTLLPALIDTALGLVETIFETIVEYLPMLIEAGVHLLVTLVEGIIEALPMLVDAAISIIVGLIEMIIENLPLLIEASIQIIFTLIEGIVEFLPMLVETAIQLILTIVESLIENLPLIIQAAVQIVVSLVEGIISMLPTIILAAFELILALIDALLSMLPDILGTGIDLIFALIEGSLSMIGEIISAALEIGGSILDTLGNINWLQLGIDIIQGMIDGILSMIGNLGSAIGEVASSIYDGVTGFFDTGSPSRLMMEVGGDVGEGLQIGVDDSAMAVAESASRLAAAAYPDVHYIDDYRPPVTSVDAPRSGNQAPVINIENHFDKDTTPEQAEKIGAASVRGAYREWKKHMNKYKREEEVRGL